MDDVWSAQDTSPGEIESALRDLLKHRHSEDTDVVPARVLNLLLIVDRDWRGEIENRLEQVGRYHPSRTILLSVEPGKDRLDALVTMAFESGNGSSGTFAVARERVVVSCGEHHLVHADTIVDPLVVTDLPTVLWSPHGHPEAIDALLKLAQVVLIDSVDQPDLAPALQRARTLAERVYVVDLAWLRSVPWRERIASSFDRPQWRPSLREISEVTVRHQPASGVAGLLFLGWLCSRLGWQPGPMISQQGALHGRARSSRMEVALKLEPEPAMSVPGLGGVEVKLASGASFGLDRGPGGLTATRVDRKGREMKWTVLGASRGEGGILGEGIRQALLRDPTYGPSLEAASALVA